jgi:hypothetical protein
LLLYSLRILSSASSMATIPRQIIFSKLPKCKNCKIMQSSAIYCKSIQRIAQFCKRLQKHANLRKSASWGLAPCET